MNYVRLVCPFPLEPGTCERLQIPINLGVPAPYAKEILRSQESLRITGIVDIEPKSLSRNNSCDLVLRFWSDLVDLIERNQSNNQSYFEDSVREDQSKTA